MSVSVRGNLTVVLSEFMRLGTGIPVSVLGFVTVVHSKFVR